MLIDISGSSLLSRNDTFFRFMHIQTIRQTFELLLKPWKSEPVIPLPMSLKLTRSANLHIIAHQSSKKRQEKERKKKCSSLIHTSRILQGGEKIWILCSRGKNNISLIRCAHSHRFKLTCNVLFIIRTYWWRRFWRFSKDFRPLCENSSKFFSKPGRTVPNIFRKISEDFRGRPEDVSIIHQRFKYNLRDKLDISEIIDIFTSEDMKNTPLESRMWFRMNFTSGIRSHNIYIFQ